MRAVRLRLKLSMPLLRSLGFWFSEYLQIRRTYGAAETGSGGNTTCQGEGARAAGDTGEHGRKGVTFPSDVSDVSGGSRDAADQIRGGSRLRSEASAVANAMADRAPPAIVFLTEWTEWAELLRRRVSRHGRKSERWKSGGAGAPPYRSGKI